MENTDGKSPPSRHGATRATGPAAKRRKNFKMRHAREGSRPPPGARKFSVARASIASATKQWPYRDNASAENSAGWRTRARRVARDLARAPRARLRLTSRRLRRPSAANTAAARPLSRAPSGGHIGIWIPVSRKLPSPCRARMKCSLISERNSCPSVDKIGPPSRQTLRVVGHVSGQRNSLTTVFSRVYGPLASMPGR